MRVLNIAEKPSVAKELAAILAKGAAQRATSKSKFNPAFQFEFSLRGQRVTMVVTSVSGHMMSLDVVPEYQTWRSCDPARLFDVPVIKFVQKDHQDVDSNIRHHAKSCQMLVLWLDCDREGENIAFEVIQRCTEVNPRLQILRARFSALIPRDIFRACENLVAPNENEALAVDARQEVDLRTGAAFTRFQTLRFQAKFKDLDRCVLSYGPCQFPTLGFVIDRYWYIENFVREPFWSIKVTAVKDNANVSFTWRRGRLFDQLACFILYEQCVETPNAVVTKVNGKPVKKYRPFPMNTVALQKLAAKKLRLGSEQCMKIAEDLYQRGFLSYPRTETTVFQQGTDFHALIKEQASDREWGQYAQSLLDGRFVNPKAGKENDNSHPPIHPTKHTSNFTSPQERQVYELVVRHFLACCSDDAIGAQTDIEIDIAGEIFYTSGLMILERNFLDIYKYMNWADRDIPAYQVGELFIPAAIEMQEGRTEPPQLLTEAELIELMDKNGIGTDATIAQHIQTILKRQYAEKHEQYFVPTTLGLALVAAYENAGLNMTQPQLRAKTEADLKRICAGTLNKRDYVQQALEEYRHIYATLSRNGPKLDEAMSVFFK